MTDDRVALIMVQYGTASSTLLPLHCGADAPGTVTLGQARIEAVEQKNKQLKSALALLKVERPTRMAHHERLSLNRGLGLVRAPIVPRLLAARSASKPVCDNLIFSPSNLCSQDNGARRALYSYITKARR